jgi:hypothetical protein
MPSARVTKATIMNTKNNVCGIQEAPAATPPNPTAAAIMEMSSETAAHTTVPPLSDAAPPGFRRNPWLGDPQAPHMPETAK